MLTWRTVERLLAILVVAPPVYLAMRYLRWYFRQNNEEQESE